MHNSRLIGRLIRLGYRQQPNEFNKPYKCAGSFLWWFLIDFIDAVCCLILYCTVLETESTVLARDTHTPTHPTQSVTV